LPAGAAQDHRCIDRRNIAGLVWGEEERMRIFSTILLPIGGRAGSTAAQQRSPAGLQACNPTGLEVAKVLDTGVSDGTSPAMISESWFKLPPNAFTFLSSGRRRSGRNLLYAQDRASKRGGTGAGPACVGPRAFTIPASACGTSHQRRLVRTVDMGRQGGRAHNFTS
jgi:uncharacterized membrane protein